MKRVAGLAFASMVAASLAYPISYYALEVRGGSRIYAVDEPVRKGRVLLFHRYPDGVYVSLAASEVEKIVSTGEPPAPEASAPGQAVFIGPALEGPRYQMPPAVAPVPPTESTMDSGYGYYGWYWGGGYVPPSPPRPPQPVPPSHIGPNGFPILAPPGSPGSKPPPIGPNGFPVLAPAPGAPTAH